jgi:regulator of sigma E protease
MRGDSLISAIIVPERSTLEQEDGSMQEVGQVGIWGAIELKRVGPIRAITNGGRTLWSLAKLIVDFLVKLITRQESLRNVGGPVFIAKMAGDSARSGAGALFGFMAFLSLNLGILNLLPIPVLDGGHLLMIGIEGVSRRTIPTKIKLVIQQVFMFLLLALMLFVVYNDVLRIVKK